MKAKDSVIIQYPSGKQRQCPLWKETKTLLLVKVGLEMVKFRKKNGTMIGGRMLGAKAAFISQEELARITKENR